MNLPVKVSVLMPVYNSEKYLKEAIDSILNQAFRDFEFLIIDDASTDKSVEIIQTYIDDRIILIRKPLNTGIPDSLNLGIGISKGEYIARMDSDDISLPQRFEKQVAFLQQNPSVILCGTSFRQLATDTVVVTPSDPEDIKVSLLDQSCIAHPTVMFRKDILSTNGIRYNTNDEPAEDYNLWVRLSEIGPLANIDEVLFEYRVHDEQTSTVRKALGEKNADKARVAGIKQLIPDMSATEIKTHLALIKSEWSSAKQLEQVCAWGEHIIKVNNDKKVFDRVKFERLVKSKTRNYVRDFFFFSPYNFESLKLLYNPVKKYHKHFTLPEQLKFMVKCLTPYKHPHISDNILPK